MVHANGILLCKNQSTFQTTVTIRDVTGQCCKTLKSVFFGSIKHGQRRNFERKILKSGGSTEQSHPCTMDINITTIPSVNIGWSVARYSHVRNHSTG